MYSEDKISFSETEVLETQVKVLSRRLSKCIAECLDLSRENKKLKKRLREVVAFCDCCKKEEAVFSISREVGYNVCRTCIVKAENQEYRIVGKPVLK